MDDEQTPPFAFGDGTLMQLRDQAFEIDDYGTRMATHPATVGVASEPGAAVSSDPLVRIEQQLADLIHVVESLQRRLDSIDATLARVLAR